MGDGGWVTADKAFLATLGRMRRNRMGSLQVSQHGEEQDSSGDKPGSQPQRER